MVEQHYDPDGYRYDEFLSRVRYYKERYPDTDPVGGSPALHGLFIDQKVVNSLLVDSLMDESLHSRLSEGIMKAFEAGARVLSNTRSHIRARWTVDRVYSPYEQSIEQYIGF